MLSLNFFKRITRENIEYIIDAIELNITGFNQE